MIADIIQMSFEFISNNAKNMYQYHIHVSYSIEPDIEKHILDAS